MKTSEIRSKFIEYFQRQHHTIVESSSLVPSNDPTLLFTTAGMVQFKDVFLGKDKRSYTRATTVQKCVRAGGKHNDLENVGFTARHHTFFEMLGNFSFGDYFKKEAIHFAWQFVTQELKLPLDRLYVSVFETDDEALKIWHEQEKVPLDRIYKFGEKDNFWSMGDTGPCGPCTELFVDRGEKYGCGKPTCQMGCDCDRYMEFWNLVFMQYDRDASGKLTPLPRPSVDTGAGLERIAMILQDVTTNYDTDGFIDIIRKTSQLAGVAYDPQSPQAVSFRVIADHSRAATFLIGDGVLPSNEGRGYVLRRIMRRAIRHGRKIGLNEPFLNKTAGFVIDQMVSAYPDLKDKRQFIEKAILAEEEQFFKTLERGLSLLEAETQQLTSSQKQLSGEVAFKLYDTYGFPLDLTRVICEEKGLSVDEAGFTQLMAAQKAESRKHWKGSGQEALSAIYHQIQQELSQKGTLPVFTGYTELATTGTCLKILRVIDGQLTSVTEVKADYDEVIVEAIFDQTPFYAESGGQAGDQGVVIGSTPQDFEGQVLDVQKPLPQLIVVELKLTQGTLKVGQPYLQKTSETIRHLTARNHTATHLLHWALREVLGTHVKQAGSLVNSDLLRFDFTHFSALTPQELQEVETRINEKIWMSYPVQKKEMKKDQAIAMGAIAMFGEKYSDDVRVVSVGNFSTELCGGTHVNDSSEIHLFKIISETGIASGVRRIIAYTSQGAFEYLKSRNALLIESQNLVKAQTPEDVPYRIEKILDQERALRKQLEQIQAQAAAGEADELIKNMSSFSKGKLIMGLCQPDEQGIKKLRELSDTIKNKVSDAVIILGMSDPAAAKASLVVCVGSGLAKTVNANEILKNLVTFIDAKGGGKPDFAQAGGTNPQGFVELFKAAKNL